MNEETQDVSQPNWWARHGNKVKLTAFYAACAAVGVAIAQSINAHDKRVYTSGHKQGCDDQSYYMLAAMEHTKQKHDNDTMKWHWNDDITWEIKDVSEIS